MTHDTTRSNWLHEKTEASASAGMVSSRHPLSAEAGLKILKAGGNAVDAAVAASFAESVVQPAASTIGGGGLFAVRTAGGEAHCINYMWQTPRRATVDMFPIEGVPRRGLFGWSGVKDRANEIGGLAAAIPGSVAGLVKASREFGRLPLAEVMQPAISLAHDGFPMDWYGSLMAGIHLDILKAYPATAVALLREGEFPYRPNMIGPADIHKQPALARTLKAIAAKGAKAFYAGSIADSIVEAVNAHGGIFTREDLEEYEAVVGQPAETNYRGYAVKGEASAFTIYAQVLNVLSHFDFPAMRADAPARLHVFIEAFRHCLRDRGMVDPGDTSTDAPWRHLVSPAYSAQLAGNIDAQRRSDIASPFGAVKEAPRTGDTRTVHIAAIDAEGSMASLTETVIGNYGCFVTSESGVLLNNGMISFAPVAGYPNSIAPRKRSTPFMTPLHFTAPDGKAIMTIGSSGGTKIMTSVLQIASYIIDHGMSPQQAASFPRVDFEGDNVVVDPRFGDATIERLKGLGHPVVVRAEELSTFDYGNPCVLARDANGIVRGGVNPYQATVAVGYN